MNVQMRLLLLPALVMTVTACSTIQSPESSSTPLPVPDLRSPLPTSRSSESPVSASPMASHDMGGMGDMDNLGDETGVEIAGFAYEPADLTIPAGTTVVFTNTDTAPHTITAGSDDAPQPKLFDSGLLQQGESFMFVFDEPGTYHYFCDRHPPMRGSITVER